MSPLFEVIMVKRLNKQEWEDLGQHGDPPQVQHVGRICWQDVRGIDVFVPELWPHLELPESQQAHVMMVEYTEVVALGGYEEVSLLWQAWLEGERKRKTFARFGHLLN